MKQCYLTLGAVVRNQEHYVKEWLAFHHLVGVERFVIVLHKCTDKTEERIRELPFQDKIHIHRIVNDEQFVQLGTYLWILEHYGRFTKWMMFIDSDEFFFGTREDDLRVILTDYEKHGVDSLLFFFGVLILMFLHGRQPLIQILPQHQLGFFAFIFSGNGVVIRRGQIQAF